MAETEPGTPPDRARIGNTGEGGRRQPATRLSHQPRDEELSINHLVLRRDDARPDFGERAAQRAARDGLAALIAVVRSGDARDDAIVSAETGGAAGVADHE